MYCHFLLASVFASCTQALAPVTIRWGDFQAANSKRFVLAAPPLPNVAVGAPQKLKIWDFQGTPYPSKNRYFGVKLDKTIIWQATGFCVEALGDEIGVNQCTGSPNQLWNFLPSGNGGRNKIQLGGSDKCIDVNGNKGDLNGAPVVLRACDSKATESWMVEPLTKEPMLFHTHDPSQHPTPFHAAPAGPFIFLAMVGVLSLCAWLRHWQGTIRAVKGMKGDVEWGSDHGGIVLTVPLAMRQGVVMGTALSSQNMVVPAAMVVSQSHIEDNDNRNDHAKDAVTQKYAAAWRLGVKQYAAYLGRGGKAKPYLSRELGPEQGFFQSVFMGPVRHQMLCQYMIELFVKKQPKTLLRAVLGVSIAELRSSPKSDAAKIVHHAVESAKDLLSSREVGLVNAVLRKVSPELEQLATSADGGDVEKMAIYYSHPSWLIRMWLECWSEVEVLKLLQWGELPPPVYLRVLNDGESQSLLSVAGESQWKGFFQFEGRDWAGVQTLLDTGVAYIQDPATRIAPELLAVRPGEKVLDLCAAPGGKSLFLADGLRGNPESLLVCVDRPGSREGLVRLRENLQKIRGTRVHCIERDILELSDGDFVEASLPTLFDAILIDVPCSNTGVLRRKPDAKWRLRPGDIGKIAKEQLVLLERAVRFLRPGGRIVYSTCSLVRKENEGVVDAFMAKQGDYFELKQQVISAPWETEHDGAGVFLLHKKEDEAGDALVAKRPASERDDANDSVVLSTAVQELANELQESGWREALQEEFTKPYFSQIADFAQAERSKFPVHPPPDKVFEAFNVTPFAKVKVVILGQDPYHEPGQAHGLCFSVLPGIAPPQSVKNMYKELQTDIAGFTPPSHGHLLDWAKQGVLMLNATLTVREGGTEANSHAKCGWQKFTDEAIRALNNRDEGIVFLLWGSDAQKKGKLVDKSKHKVIESAHPSRWSWKKHEGCKTFSKCNIVLKAWGLSEIDWQLT